MIVISEAFAYPILSAVATWIGTYCWLRRHELFGNEEVKHEVKREGKQRHS